jgi:hypothetical protein
MLEILQFIFRDFWTWLGTLILLSVVAGAFVGAVTALRGGRDA